MIRAGLIILIVTFALAVPPKAYADKDTACEAYALGAMRQIQKAGKYKNCAQRGFFKGARWTNSFSYHFDGCARRYVSGSTAHQAFTIPERKARDGELQRCVVQSF